MPNSSDAGLKYLMWVLSFEPIVKAHADSARPTQMNLFPSHLIRCSQHHE